MERKKEHVKTLAHKDYLDNNVSIFMLNDTYYSVEYRGKEEYYSKNYDTCELVAKLIIKFYRTLYEGNKIFYSAKDEEQAWQELISYLSIESQKTSIDKDLCISIYKSIELRYYDQVDKVDRAISNTRNTIQSKDNLMKTIKQIVALSNPTESNTVEVNKNYNRYRTIRNKFIQENAELNLGLLK